jgi:hypothetical protein
VQKNAYLPEIAMCAQWVALSSLKGGNFDRVSSKLVCKILQLQFIFYDVERSLAITDFRQVMIHHHFESQSSKKRGTIHACSVLR